jgi:hypothetical protein
LSPGRFVTKSLCRQVALSPGLFVALRRFGWCWLQRPRGGGVCRPRIALAEV